YFAVFEAGYRPKHASLFGIPEMVLKSNQSVRIGHQIFLPKLHACVRLRICSRVIEALWLHRTISQSVDAASGQFLKWQTRLKPLRLFKAFYRNRFSLDQLVIKPSI